MNITEIYLVYPRALPAFSVNPHPQINPVVQSQHSPQQDYGAGLTDLSSVREKIVSAAGLKGFGDIDAQAGEAIEFLINVATRNDTAGNEAQKVLRDLYANPDCAHIRDNLQKAAYNMCKIAHVAKGSSAPLSVTVACMGGAIAQGDVRHFLNAYLNNRLNNQPTVDVLGSNWDVRPSDLEASGKTLKNVIVKGDLPITLDAGDAKVRENANTLTAMRQMAIQTHKPVVALVNSASPDFPHWIQVVIAPKDGDSGVDWYTLNSPSATSAGREALNQLGTLLNMAKRNGDDRHAIGGFNDTPNSSGVLGDRFIRALDGIAGQKNGSFEGWIGPALTAKGQSWSIASAEDKQAALLASQAEILDAAAAATDAEVAKVAAQALNQAHANYGPPAAFYNPPNGFAGAGNNALQSQRPSAGGMPAPTVPSNSPMATASVQGAALALLKNKGERLNIGYVRPFAASGFRSAFTDLKDYRDAQHEASQSSRNRRFNRFMPKPRSASWSFNDALQGLETTIRENNFSKIKPPTANETPSAIYKTMQKTASTDAIKNLAARPALFLQRCHELAYAARDGTPQVRAQAHRSLRTEAVNFIADQVQMAGDIEADLNALSSVQGPERVNAMKLYGALQEIQKDCLEGALYEDVIAFAKQANASPDTAFQYFDSLPKPPIGV